MADTAFLRRIATDASTDPRTVKKNLEGSRVSALPRERITYALIDRGLSSYVRGPVSLDTSPKSRA